MLRTPSSRVDTGETAGGEEFERLLAFADWQKLPRAQCAGWVVDPVTAEAGRSISHHPLEP